MRTRRLARQIQAVLQPLTGTRSSGSALVYATGDDVELPVNTLGYPIVSGTLDPSRPVRVDETTTVTAAGVSVPLTSLLGGEQQNFPEGTKIRWVPPVVGVELASDVGGAFTGGTSAAGPGALRKLATYRQIGNVEAASALFFARAGGPFPAGVLEWLSTEYLETRGSQTTEARDRWRLVVVSARLDGHDQRSDENFDGLDAIEELLVTRSSVDGDVFSSPGVELLGRENAAITPTSYLDAITFATHTAVTRKDARDFPPWLLTSFEMLADQAADDERDPHVMHTSHVEMPQ